MKHLLGLFSPVPLLIRVTACGLRCGLFAFLVVACGSQAPDAQLRRLAPDATILAFGDSLTYGTGAQPQQSYPAVLEGLTGLDVVRSGIPGETTREGLKRLPRVLEEVQPDLVILCLGGNDMLRRQDRTQMKQNLADMIAMIREQGAEIVLLGVPEPSLFGLEAEPAYTELARQYGIPIEATSLADILSDESRKADQIHPNAQGYADLGKAVAELLRRSGAIADQ